MKQKQCDFASGRACFSAECSAECKENVELCARYDAAQRWERYQRVYELKKLGIEHPRPVDQRIGGFPADL